MARTDYRSPMEKWSSQSHGQEHDAITGFWINIGCVFLLIGSWIALLLWVVMP